MMIYMVQAKVTVQLNDNPAVISLIENLVFLFLAIENMVFQVHGKYRFWVTFCKTQLSIMSSCLYQLLLREFLQQCL